MTIWIVCFDGSEGSRNALQKVLELQKEGDKIELMQVAVETPESEWPFISEEEAKNLTEDAKAATEEVLAKAAKELEVHGISVTTTCVVAYDARKGIMDTLDSRMEEGGEKILVLGARGMGAIKGLILGSTSQYCVRNSKIPVLVVPPPS
eukprot:CAMPEP_0174260432 /NCGR_PEP_ID=MMETSP0439-20130205/9709_1 /TAXON_ID=0 /ORGANISM="Stereomyxa ramosa, Strain Chinc5" /LENGTH=149 /DNA_ID=CAMNT_0015344679 /DNA_START=28 /DNA_END=477 /DNA_ORIENTATION=-